MQDRDLRQIDLNLLVVLLTLLKTSSVSRTAQRLGMSQPAVSRALASLRALLADPLFVKRGAAMVPTPRSLGLTEPLQTALAAVTALLERSDQFEPKSSQRLFRISTTDYGATVILPHLGQAFFREAPNAKLEILPLGRQPFVDLANGDLDLVLYGDRPSPQALRTRDLFRERYVCLVREGHPALFSTIGDRLTLESFLAHAHILVTVTGGRTGPVDAALEALGRERRIGMWLPYFATAALTAAKSDLLLTIPRRAAEAFAGFARLRILQPPIQLEEFGYRMVWHERMHHELAHGWLRRLIASVLREECWTAALPARTTNVRPPSP